MPMPPVPRRCPLGAPGWPQIIPLGQGCLGTTPSTLQGHGHSRGQAGFSPRCLPLHHHRRWDATVGGEAKLPSCRHHPPVILNNKQMQKKPKQDKKQHLIIWQDLWGLMYSMKCGNKNPQLLIVSFPCRGPQAISSLALPFYGVTTIR